jgi:hypothetical protein
VMKTILRQYHNLISRVRKECNPRRDSIGHKGPREAIDIKIGTITPNPVPTGQLTAELTYGIPVDAHVVITISDQLGNVVKEVFTGDLTAGAQTQTLDLTGLSTGMYFVRIQAGPSVGTARLVIQ